MHSARALPPRPGAPASLFSPRRGGFADHPLSSDHDGGALTSPPSASIHHHESGRGPARIMPAAVEWPDSSRHEGAGPGRPGSSSPAGGTCAATTLGARRRPAAAARPPDLQAGQRCSLAGEMLAARGLESTHVRPLRVPAVRIAGFVRPDGRGDHRPPVAPGPGMSAVPMRQACSQLPRHRYRRFRPSPAPLVSRRAHGRDGSLRRVACRQPATASTHSPPGHVPPHPRARGREEHARTTRSPLVDGAPRARSRSAEESASRGGARPRPRRRPGHRWVPSSNLSAGVAPHQPFTPPQHFTSTSEPY